MQTFTVLLFFFTLVLEAVSQVDVPNTPQWQVTLRVGDEDGNPVSGANAFASYYVTPAKGESEAGSRKSGITDSNGFIVLNGHSGPRIICRADKAGFYSSSTLEIIFTNKSDAKWQPWNPMGNLYIKKIKNPIPMYAKCVNLSMPVFDKSAGYDLSAGDWVKPYGKGEITDILFNAHFDKRSRKDFEYKLTISFPNSGDGIQAFTISPNEKYSGFHSPYEAPEKGYEHKIIKIESRHPGQVAKNDYDENRNYFFRVRTVLDAQGNVQSALYGKIYGDFMDFRYYLNPTPNDRNIEFDPKQNLLKGLNFIENVNQP